VTTISKHTYAARVPDAGGDITVSLVENNPGGIDFDAGRIPHVQGQITLAVEDAMLLEQLDPRDSRRVVVDVNATFPAGTASRSFNLGIRDSKPNRADGTVTLQLASDEAILAEKAQLVDDANPRSHQASLRAVCNYVLGKIGGALQAGGPDADVTAYWAATNVLPDPACTSAANYASGGNATGLTSDTIAAPYLSPLPGGRQIYWTAPAAGQSFIEFSGGQPPAKVGDTWTIQAYMRRGGLVATTGRMRFYEISASGATLRTVESEPVAIVTNNWTLYTLTMKVQNPLTASIKGYATVQATAGGQVFALTAPMMHQAGEVIPPFSGAVNAAGGYTQSWAGAANASASTRTPIIERRPESLSWRAGVSGMDFLHPLLLAAGLRLVCDEKRQWTLRSEDYRAAGAQAWRYGVNIEGADEQLSRDDDSWFDAAVYEYVWTDADGLEQRRTDTFSIAPTPTKVLRRELRDTPFPGPGRAQHIVERAQGRGRTVAIKGIPLWTENTDQSLSVLLDGTPIQTGIAETISYDFNDDTVRVGTRTTDTPPSAWDLIPGGQRWIDSPVGASWIGEVI